MRYTVESDIGQRRSVNEDRATVISRSNEAIHLAIVADGMGGHNAGDVASTMTVEGFQKKFIEVPITAFETAESRQDWLFETTVELNKIVYKYSLENENCKGMGTTLIAAIIVGNEASICHVGDSRAYHVDADTIELITRDHSYVNVLIDSGEISEEEAATHPKKNYILKSLGTEETIEPDFYKYHFQEDEFLLICSDGLSNKLDKQELHKLVTSPQSIDTKGKQLVQLANDRGGEDNISVILAQPLTYGGEEVADR